MIRASYKTDKYERYLRRNKIEKDKLQAAVNDAADAGPPLPDVNTKDNKFKGETFCLL